MNYWNDNSKLSALNSCVQNISSSYWQDSSKLNLLNSCVQNISTVCWSDNARINALNSCVQNISSSYWVTNSSLNTVLTTYITNTPISISTMNASIRSLVCPAGSISVSTTNNGADRAIQVFNNNGTIFLSQGMVQQEIIILRQ